ncbi:MAG: response regulator [Bacilli bacterium]|nr:response regulator [Bacilli bacterium]MBN2877156.1 response regulator [Bacilli bacterium]
MKSDIQQKIDMTKETIKTSMDSFIMDAATKTYNEIFLKEYLTNYINLNYHLREKRNVYLIVMNVDNISKINVKYSNKIGDETIVNLGYLLRHTQSEDDLLFKNKGPGYILLVHDYKGKNIKNYVSEFQNAVRKAEIFVEAITISVAVVSLDEIPVGLEIAERASKFLLKANQRISYTHDLPDNAYVDKDNLVDRMTLGKILIAESDPLSLSIAKRYFELNQYKVIEAHDGVSAVKYANEQLFDAIVSDRYTYKLDGITVKQHINESSININTIFILTVQNKDVSIIEKANHIGVDYVVAKPIIFEEILGIIEREIKKRAKT